MIGTLFSPPTNFWRVGRNSHEVYGIFCTLFPIRRMDQTPNGQPPVGNMLPSVSPDCKIWTYDELVTGIIYKNPIRELCVKCRTKALHNDNNNNKKRASDDDTTLCVFYKHEKTLVETANLKMEYPEEEYKNKKGQGARLACYKRWTLLEEGPMGRRRRKPLPVCVEACIKLMNPSDTFKGFEETVKKEKDFSSDEDTWEGTLWNSPQRPLKKTKLDG